MAKRDEQLARLRVARVTGKLPADLGDWILAELEPPALRRHTRVRELQRAADATGATSRKKRALMLAAIVKTFEDLPGYLHVGWYREGTPERIIQQLMRAGSVPRSPRQLLRLIT